MTGWILERVTPDTSSDYVINRIMEAANQRNIIIEVVDPHAIDLVVSQVDEKSVLCEGTLRAVPDFIIPRLGADTTYYAMAVMRHLESLGVYTLNSTNTISTVQDKLHTQQVLAQSNLPTPKAILGKIPINSFLVNKELGFPAIIKNISGRRGQGIYLCDSEEKFVDLMELIYSNNPAANIIIQKYVKSSHGKDLRVFVLGGRVIGCIKRTAKSGFKANVSRGGGAEAFEVTPEIEWIALETARLFDLNLAGIDLLFDENGFNVCEANSSPGFKGLESISGRNIAEQILDYIALQLGDTSYIQKR